MTTMDSDVTRRGAARGPPAAARANPAPGALRALRALLSHVKPPVPLLCDEEVVLCLEIDGVRYTLTQQLAPRDTRRVTLSARELEIARLISVGHTNKTVAGVLEISLWTVDTHIRRIFVKLGVRSRSAMVAHLAELGLLE
jgi:DNA-binding CsgD family transcriptional regulator